MYAEPSVSRGKKAKAGKVTESGTSGKRQVQRAAKAQRKNGGLKRGGDYEVEDVAELFNVGLESVSPGLGGKNSEVLETTREGPHVDNEQESADDDAGCNGSGTGSTDKDDEASVGCTPSQLTSTPTPQKLSYNSARGLSVKFQPPAQTLSNSGQAGVDASHEEDEIYEIQEAISDQLREWATDPGMPLDEQKRQVRQLLAEWHPDKNRHISSVAKRIFQFIQAEVNRIISEVTENSDKAAKREAEYQERKAQRTAEKTAKSSALKSARAEKEQRKGHEQEASTTCQADSEYNHLEEFALVVRHGPATTSHLRPWPRSHLTLNINPLDSRSDEIFLFGGEAYDGRELTFYSDLYRLNVHGVDPEKALPWEKLYSSVPMIPGPEARSSHQSVIWDRFVYVFGGEWSSRDQKRYRQFNDLWRFDITSGPGARWQRMDVEVAPLARSGHRMAVSSSGRIVLFGGFNEDRKRRATYLDDLHVMDLPSHTYAWRAVPQPSDRRQRPSARAGGLLWATDVSAYVLGGVRPNKKGGDQLTTLDDAWCATVSEDSGFRWQQLQLQGEGPGKRSGLCHCAVSSTCPLRRVVFGGVLDVQVGQRGDAGKAARAGGKEVSLFHNDIFLFDCIAGSPIATWSRLWPAPGSGLPPAVSTYAADLPLELRAKGGGVDAQTLALALASGGGSQSSTAAPIAGGRTSAPRGRIAAACAVLGDALWIFGGLCEAGPKQEVTLDDFWRIPINEGSDGGTAKCGDWECVLPLSDRATMWFDDSDSSDDEEVEDETETTRSGPQKATNEHSIVAASLGAGGGVLSKKQQKEQAKQVRMEQKRDRQQEKCEEKTNKRDAKKEKQRQQAIDAASKGKAS